MVGYECDIEPGRTFAAREVDQLLDKARVLAGHDDFGDTDFIEPLTMLVQCTRADANLSPDGMQSFRQNVLRSLVNRLWMQRDFAAHPEILEEDVDDPIVIIGLPRSGTTKMQRILSALPETDIQKTHLWRMLFPAPFESGPLPDPDPRIAAVAALGFHSDSNAELASVHHMAAQEPEEDVLLFDATFDDWLWPSIYAPSPSYYEWVIRRPTIGNYRYLKRMYQYLQWQDGGRRGRRWISKNVQHIASLDELVACFPKATIVQCHRDPRQTIPSLAKLTYTLWSDLVSDLDPHFVGSCMLDWWARATDRYLETRDRMGDALRIIDLPYERIKADAAGAATEVARAAGIEMDDGKASALREWERSNPQHKHGQNPYSAAQFGLGEDAIAQRFATYIDRFVTSGKGR